MQDIKTSLPEKIRGDLEEIKIELRKVFEKLHTVEKSKEEPMDEGNFVNVTPYYIKMTSPFWLYQCFVIPNTSDRDDILIRNAITVYSEYLMY